ncbi:hypothetical protein HDU76_004301 [Blyttiomyces sp. JEL0837]|nr:hypothetical protein HDU76_004301 [Blyttiomyces sp. JEL0837]
MALLIQAGANVSSIRQNDKQSLLDIATTQLESKEEALKNLEKCLETMKKNFELSKSVTRFMPPFPSRDDGEQAAVKESYLNATEPWQKFLYETMLNFYPLRDPQLAEIQQDNFKAILEIIANDGDDVNVPIERQFTNQPFAYELVQAISERNVRRSKLCRKLLVDSGAKTFQELNPEDATAQLVPKAIAGRAPTHMFGRFGGFGGFGVNAVQMEFISNIFYSTQVPVNPTYKPEYRLLAVGTFMAIDPEHMSMYEKMFEAVWNGDVKEVRRLTLEHSPATHRPLVASTVNSMTPLMIAAWRGNLDMVKTIFEIALAQREEPKTGSGSKKGARANINNYEDSDDEGEDEDEEEDEDQDGEERIDTEEVKAPKSAVSMVYFIVNTKVSKLHRDHIPESLGKNFPLTAYSALSLATLKGHKEIVDELLRMILIATEMEIGRIQQAHDNETKVLPPVTLAELKDLSRRLAGSESKSLTELDLSFAFGVSLTNMGPMDYLNRELYPNVAHGEYLVSILATDNMEAMELLLKESLINLDIASFVPDLLKEATITTTATGDKEKAITEKPKFNGLRPPSMREKPIKRSAYPDLPQEYGGKNEFLLSQCGKLEDYKIIRALLSTDLFEKSCEYYLNKYSVLNPKDPRVITLTQLKQIPNGFQTLRDRVFGLQFTPIRKKITNKNSNRQEYVWTQWRTDTPLHAAVRQNVPKVVKELRDSFKDVESARRLALLRDRNSTIALHTAGVDDCHEVLPELLHEGFGPVHEHLLTTDILRNWNVLHFAAANGSINVIRSIIETTPTPLLTQLLQQKSNLFYQTPLMVALIQGNRKSVKQLQQITNKLGLDPGFDRLGFTPLRMAIRQARPTIINDLITKETSKEALCKDLSMEDAVGLTGISTAIQNLKVELVRNYRGVVGPATTTMKIKTGDGEEEKEVSSWQVQQKLAQQKVASFQKFGKLDRELEEPVEDKNVVDVFNTVKDLTVTVNTNGEGGDEDGEDSEKKRLNGVSARSIAQSSTILEGTKLGLELETNYPAGVIQEYPLHVTITSASTGHKLLR